MHSRRSPTPVCKRGFVILWFKVYPQSILFCPELTLIRTKNVFSSLVQHSSFSNKVFYVLSQDSWLGNPVFTSEYPTGPQYVGYALGA